MRPMKPRLAEGPHAALARFLREIAELRGEDAGQGVRIAAEFEGIDPGTLYKQLDPDQAGDVSFPRVCRLTQHFGATAAAEHLAALAGGVFLPVPQGGGPSPWGELTASAGEDFARAMGDIVRALSPQSEGAAGVTQAEGRAILEKVDQAIRDMVRLRGLAQLAAEGVAPE
jgi:hypothetical protein